MKNIIKLFILTVLSVGILFGVNCITAPIIEKNNAASQFEPLLKVMPEAKDFEVVYDAKDASASSLKDVATTVTTVYKETSGLGYVALCATQSSYSGSDYIQFAIGFTSDGKITGTNVTNYPDSKGNSEYASYVGTFTGEDSTLVNVGLISGATFSSKAIKTAVSDAFNTLIVNDMLKAAEKGTEQILTEMIEEKFSAMSKKSEITVSGSIKKAYKASNNAGFAFVGETTLVLVNADGYAVAYDKEGSDVTATEQAFVDECKAVASANQVAASNDSEANSLAALVGAKKVEKITLNSFTTVVAAYKLDGKNYGFVAKTYGFLGEDELMVEYFVINDKGQIVSMSVKSLYQEEEFFSNKPSTNAQEYMKGFIGLTSETYTGDQALISGATMTTNAIKTATEDAFKAYKAIKGE